MTALSMQSVRWFNEVKCDLLIQKRKTLQKRIIQLSLQQREGMQRYSNKNKHVRFVLFNLHDQIKPVIIIL